MEKGFDGKVEGEEKKKTHHPWLFAALAAALPGTAVADPVPAPFVALFVFGAVVVLSVVWDVVVGCDPPAAAPLPPLAHKLLNQLCMLLMSACEH